MTVEEGQLKVLDYLGRSYTLMEGPAGPILKPPGLSRATLNVPPTVFRALVQSRRIVRDGEITSEGGVTIKKWRMR